MIESLGSIERIDPSAECMHASGTYQFEFTHHANYLDPARQVQLYGWLENRDGRCRCLLSEQFVDADTFADAALKLSLEPIDLGGPLPLAPVYIEKPWGQEIWYTGIEARGVSTVNSTPLSWLLDVFGNLLGVDGDPLLLKILDPFPDENLGDLYFEMHDQKVEVYVVTSIDAEAWPDGVGKIRYGFNEARLTEFDSAESFIESYLGVVSDYQTVRSEIDKIIINQKLATGLGKDAPLIPTQHAEFLNKVPEQLISKEQALRAAMYDYTDMIDLRLGDVVRVRPLTPHSLQHGVRVVEFQTPHYERYILSFGQQVLTQDHWDTAVLREKLNNTRDDPLAASDETVIAEFNEFKVERLAMDAGDTTTFTPDSGYCIVMGIEGTSHITIDQVEQTLDPEEARLIPAGMTVQFSNKKGSRSSLLIASERDH